jgi:ATP-dependent DNA helicase RecQ
MTPALALAFSLFRLGTAIEDVMHQLKKARTTVVDYLCEYIRAEKPADAHFWIDQPTYDTIAQAAREVGTERLKPIFVKLGEKYEYDRIRIVVAHLTREA